MWNLSTCERHGTGIYPGLKLPRVPGHEVVGRIEALGNGWSKWKIVNGSVSA